jgi:hypothetical protein
MAVHRLRRASWSAVASASYTVLLALFERRLCRRNPQFLGEASEGAVEALSDSHTPR